MHTNLHHITSSWVQLEVECILGLAMSMPCLTSKINAELERMGPFMHINNTVCVKVLFTSAFYSKLHISSITLIIHIVQTFDERCFSHEKVHNMPK